MEFRELFDLDIVEIGADGVWLRYSCFNQGKARLNQASRLNHLNSYAPQLFATSIPKNSWAFA